MGLGRRRWISGSSVYNDVLSIPNLEDRIRPTFTKTANSKLSILTWPTPPRNVLIVKKRHVPVVRGALVSLARHLKGNYPSTNIILEPSTAHSVHHELDFPVYTLPPSESNTPFPYTQSTYPRTPQLNPRQTHIPQIPQPSTSETGDKAINVVEELGPGGERLYHDKTDLLITLGGDGTILHAASLFSACRMVPPVLSFAMGTLGFLGEWKWEEHAEAVGEAFAGGAMVLRRERLKVGVYDDDGKRVTGEWEFESIGDAHAMNEVNIHRGKSPHLAIVEVFVDGRFLTEAVADGMIIATPTGSTAYSLSSGGSIVHPSVSSLLLTPICPRSLSFRPLVLPADCVLTLKLSAKNRAGKVEVSVDGRHWGGIGRGEEVRVWAEKIDGDKGGIPCLKGRIGGREDDGWVGGLNGLLKFNYPFGEEE
ncbi:ATP-NAD kinase [Choiromyces venosus 120613-1]|uniref:ATP-NAD kinase n=1 Tax=Choiromyces venosus 120613-1 TaxID=1336337 RepID=A0A3N4K6I4_9PEZI|nr:ATP-NAD kinase [Choiromyces venosus 120613-1]